MKFTTLLSSLLYFTIATDVEHGDDMHEVEETKTKEGNVCHFTYGDTQCKDKAGVKKSCIYGPHEWAAIPHTTSCKHQCDATDAQSPIDIVSSNAEKINTNTLPLSLQFNYNDEEENNWHKDAADGLSFHGSCSDCSLTVTAQSPTQPEKKEFTLRQLHFHTPSEHTVDGKLMDGELHLVHQHGNATEFLVVGLFLEVVDDVDEVDPFVQDLFGSKGLEYAKNSGFLFTDVGKAQFTSIHKNGFEFYHYKGGFTTPPCTEAVQWFVRKTPLKVHRNTIEAHKKVNGVEFVDAPSLDDVKPSKRANFMPRYNVQEALKERSNLSASGSGGNNRPTVGENNKSTLYSGSIDEENTVAENVKVSADDDSNHDSFELKAPAKLIKLVHLESSPKVFIDCPGETCTFGQWGIVKPKEEILVVLKKLDSKESISATKATEKSLEFASEKVFPPGKYQVLFDGKEVDLVHSTASINVEVKAVASA